MAQVEIYEIMKKNPTKWFSSQDFKQIPAAICRIKGALNKLEKSGFIKSKIVITKQIVKKKDYIRNRSYTSTKNYPRMYYKIIF